MTPARLARAGSFLLFLFSLLPAVAIIYYYDPKIVRKLHTDIRYVLFLAEKVDGALNVLEEMTIVR